MPSPQVPYRPSRAAVAGHMIQRLLASFPVACFILALAADIAYWRTSNLVWVEFSAWLLLAGITVGVAAAVFGAIYYLVRFRTRAVRFGWPAAIGTLVVLILAFFNNLAHAADGWTAVMPWGLTLSALTVLAVLVTLWLSTSFAYGPALGEHAYD
ncbi:MULTISPECIES: DUF2231 domain-containing protein [Microvirga]|uniref:DUF2231 domain-containing protein n=1 Tax=Microvirga TaxID=186650 RepID=UPI0021CAB19B|nr:MULTISPECIES: DUF2231 domain-containing protein [unclassified Microvirga]